MSIGHTSIPQRKDGSRSTTGASKGLKPLQEAEELNRGEKEITQWEILVSRKKIPDWKDGDLWINRRMREIFLLVAIFPLVPTG